MSKASNLAGFSTSISPPASLNVGVVTATSFFGSGSGLTGVGIGTDGNVNTTGIITATSFVGNGSGLTGVGPSSQDVTSVAGITTINLSLGNVIYFTHNTDTTVAFANTTTTQEITFIRVKDNTSTPRSITWPSSLRWNNIVLSTGAGPILSNTSKDNSAQTFSLITRNSGINWYGWEESSFPGDNLALFSWGLGSSGQLGQTNRTQFSSPVQIPGTSWSSIAGGTIHSLATKTDNTLWSWGNGANGRLGQNDTTQFSSPIQIPGTTWSAISATQHSLATKTDGTLWSWGQGSNGQLGQNNRTQFSSPVQIPGTTWSSISGGNEHSLATKTDGTLWSWGLGSVGRLGQNSTVTRSSPIQIPGTSWSSISGGDYHSLATKTDGTLWSWGDACKWTTRNKPGRRSFITSTNTRNDMEFY
jgi:alpha-tubulin suppressor-like RCC1 family protein